MTARKFSDRVVSEGVVTEQPEPVVAEVHGGADSTIQIGFRAPDSSFHEIGEIDRGQTHVIEIRRKPEPTVRQTLDVVVAIPAYNEESTIAKVVTQASEYADRVVVVDDGSQDETAVQAESAGATVIEHERNRGYGAALKTAFREAQRYDTCHLVIIDGDDQHSPADIPRLVDTQRRSGAPLVVGSRFVDGATSNAPFYRRIGLLFINFLTNLSLGVVRPSSWVNDTQSGFRVYDRDAISTLVEDDSIGDMMDASTDILYHVHRHGYTIEEIPISIEYDVENASSQNPVSHGIVLVRNILKTVERERPLTTLALPGLAAMLGGAGFGYWAVLNYLNLGTFSIGLVLTSVFLMLVGIFTCFTAIVLHSLSTHFPNGMGQ